MKFKDDMSIASADQMHFNDRSDRKAFKALPLNKSIFKQVTRLPSVEKRTQTSFSEFKLSKSNGRLGKKTFIEYVQNKENEKSRGGEFRALSLDKKILEGPSCT